MQTELFPQSKDEFVLPEKWYVKRTQQNCDLINAYFSDLNRKRYSGPSQLMITNFDYMHSPAFKGKRYPIGRTSFVFPRKEYTEITFEQFKNYVMKKEKVIVNWFIRGSKDLRDFMSTQDNVRKGISGEFQNAGYYIRYDGQWDWQFVDNLEAEKEISLEDYLKSKEEKLPEKWYISGGLHLMQFFREYEDTFWNGDSDEVGYWKEGELWRMERKDKIPDRVKITLEQYKKFTMKNDKKIKGYKLKFPEYEKAAVKIGDGEFIKNSNIDFTADSRMSRTFSEIGLLDVWFEPVYEPEPKLPSIKGKDGRYYDGSIDKDCIVYGCARILIQWFSESFSRSLTYMPLNSGVIISEDEVKSIRKYLEYHGLK